MKPELLKLEAILGVTFSDHKTLISAITHRSFLNENRNATQEHNERLEFLGDAVLELVITDYLFSKYPEKPEGELTSVRAALVNTNTLAEASTKLGINDFLLLSKGEAKDTGRARLYILANAYEAITGAIYLDQGYNAAANFISENILEVIDIEEIVEKKSWIDAKSRFQERAQEKTGQTPNYRTLKETGPDHDKQFTLGVFLGDTQVATGTGPSKQEAEQKAAEKALEIKAW